MISQASGRRRLGALAGVSMAALAAAGAAHAASGAEAAAAAASSDGTVQEVVVTAEKRQTTVQKAAVAITAVSSDLLQKDDIRRVNELNGEVPGLTVAKNGPYNQVVAIRGVGYDTGDNGSSQPGVSFHVDGVYIARPDDLGVTFLDPVRVEVLRGPQGTVFGQASTGGAINVITAKPTTSGYNGYASASYGAYNLFKVNGALNVPVNDKVALRVAFDKTQHDGFSTETGLHDYKLDDENDYAGKVSLLLQPTSDLSLTLSAQGFRQSNHGAGMKSIYDPDPDPRHISQDFPNTYKLGFFLASADLEWNLPFATFKSLTAYQQSHNMDNVDNGRLSYSIIHRYDYAYWNNSGHTVSQEFDLSSKAGGRVDWILGAFYMKENSSGRFYEFEGTDAHPTITFPTSQATLPYNFNYSVFTYYVRQTYAGFGQATVHITPWLRLTGGVRYTDETIHSVTNTDFLLYKPLTFLKTSDSELTGKVELDADVTPANMIYGSWSRGFKPGGVNLNNDPVLAPQIFKPETVSAFEIGSKNRFLDNRLTVNMAGFFYDYKNFQYEEEDPIPYQGGVSNVPDAHIYGVEAEGDFAITKSIRLTGNITRLKGNFTQNYVALDPSLAAAARAAAAALGYGPYNAYTINAVLAAARNTNGNPVPKTPDWQGSLALEDTADIYGGVLRSRVEFVYRGNFVYRIFDTAALDRVQSYGIWNLNFEYTPYQSKFTYSLTATNLFNKAGVETRYSNPFGSFTTDQQYIPPLQVFGTVRYAF